ncbi:MAG: asparagine synthase (glutamine-hydrolyzing) [Fluviicola sp.]
MCGIAGIVSFNRRNEHINQGVLERMCAAIKHRGPDDQDLYISDEIGFGFRRLSIVDVSGGRQPMTNEDGSLIMVCNGEIFNFNELRKELEGKGHIFATNADVEVILHLYEEEGIDLVKRLDGQFSFAIFDRRKRRVILARDPFGVTPLFYTITDDLDFIFASEIKALLHYPGVNKTVNLNALDQIITFPGLVSPNTMFEGIYSFRPGELAIFENGTLNKSIYWDLDYPLEGATHNIRSYEEYKEALDDLLQKSIKKRLQADVPLGFYLSGGLDSSLVTGVIKNKQLLNNFPTFSVEFLTGSINEVKYQKEMVNYLQSQHHSMLFDYLEIEKRLKQAIWHAETPIKETYNTCSLALSELVRANGVKVVLSGEGADELFAGYVGYRFDKERAQKMDFDMDLDAIMENEMRAKLWGDESFFYEREYLAFEENKRSIYSNKLSDSLHDFGALYRPFIDTSKIIGRNKVHQRSYIDFKMRISDHLLSDHGDRVAFANSVEGRYPFLDKDLVEFVTTVPSEYKLRGMEEKYILKQIAADYIPQSIINREKFSFVAPGCQYLLQNKVEWVMDMLSYAQIKNEGYFNPDVIERLKKQYLAPSFSVNQTFEIDLLMIVLTFGIFKELYQIPNLN